MRQCCEDADNLRRRQNFGMFVAQYVVAETLRGGHRNGTHSGPYKYSLPESGPRKLEPGMGQNIFVMSPGRRDSRFVRIRLS